MPIWPEILPVYPLLQGYRETMPETVLRSDMETGPAKLRQRSTATISKIHLQFLVNDTQLTAFRDFYQETLSGGALGFSFYHPTKLENVTCRFATPYEVVSVNGTFHRVQAVLEVMP